MDRCSKCGSKYNLFEWALVDDTCDWGNPYSCYEIICGKCPRPENIFKDRLRSISPSAEVPTSSKSKYSSYKSSFMPVTNKNSYDHYYKPQYATSNNSVELEKLRIQLDNKNITEGILRSQLDLLQKQEKSEPVNNDNSKCVVCIENNKEILLEQCNHLCLCNGCAALIIKGSNIQCPMCRVFNTSWKKIYV